MKILLIGEYSRLHNSLKEGLLKLQHDILLIGTGDGFKNYPVDITIKSTLINKPILTFINKGLYKVFNLDLLKLEVAYKFYKLLPQLKTFDVVQLINENSLKTYPKLEVWLLKKLQKQNNKLFLLSSGTDYISVNYANNKGFKYSILTPFHKNKNLKKVYNPILKYITKPYYKLHQFLYNTVNGIIASDLDYHIPLKNKSKYLGLIQNPINIDLLHFQPLKISEKVVIFHGINSMNYIKKGNNYFENALKIIQEKHPKKVKIITSRDTPYKEYIDKYNQCHILLDQVFSYDQGYNALEAMAKGKVVFTGAEQEWLKYYNIEEKTIAINALPNVKTIVKDLEWLILNPNKIIEISKNARRFIEKEHHYIKIAGKYIEIWNNN